VTHRDEIERLHLNADILRASSTARWPELPYRPQMRIALFATLIACASPTTTTTPTAMRPPDPVVRTPDPAPPAFRLPGDVVPVRYRLDQTIVPTADGTSGAIHINARVVRATGVVWLNATDVKVVHAELAGKPARVIPGGDDFVGLVADAELPVGVTMIDVTYTAGIDRERSRGVYSQKEGETGETYAYTFFEATDARRAFPCFDEPAYKVPWTLVFHVKKDHVALANAPVVRETDEPNGMKKVEIAESKPLPSYLVAFVVGPFEVIDAGTAGRVKTPIRFIVPKGRARELGYAKEVTPKVLVALESYFDMGYPYGKLDVAVVPRYWGTMEHPGIVAMGQPLTLIRPDEASRNRKQHYTSILAHEMSHYWFGDLVTMKWWDDTWLNEALGEWSDMNITEAAEPSWRYRDSRVGIALEAMQADETLAAHPIRRNVTSKTDIQASFDNDITYFKGSSVLRMFEAFAGRDAWRGFIHDYMTKHAWGNASAEDFVDDMQATLGQPIADGFRSFLGQAGVPLVEITANCPAKTLTLHQRRSLMTGVTDPAEHVWHVPVCVRYGDAKTSKRVCKLLDKAEDTIAIDSCPTWIQPNDDGVGYYRSKVDVALIKHELSHIAGTSASDKMMSVSDLRAGVDRGDLTIDKVLEIAPLVVADPDDKVAQYGVVATNFRSDVLDEPLYQASIRYFERVFGPLAQRLGWTRGKNDSDDRNRLRSTALAVTARWNAKLGAQAEKLADAWVADHSGLDNDLVNVALSVAAYRGDAARFDRYLAAARKAHDRSEQQRLLGVLGDFRDPALAKRALDLVLDGGFDLRDSIGIAFDVIYSRDNRELGWTWFKDHIDTLLARMRDDEAARLLSGAAEAYCDPVHRKAVEELVKPRTAKIAGADNYVKRSLETSDQCIANVARQLPALEAFLKP
jgi:aminopeptidase N